MYSLFVFLYPYIPPVLPAPLLWDDCSLSCECWGRGCSDTGQPAYTAPGGTNFWPSLGNTHLKIQVYAFIQNKGDVIRRAISSINWACSYERVLSAICFSLCIVQGNVQKAYFEYCKMHSSALTSQQYPLCFHFLVCVCSL